MVPSPSTSTPVTVVRSMMSGTPSPSTSIATVVVCCTMSGTPSPSTSMTVVVVSRTASTVPSPSTSTSSVSTSMSTSPFWFSLTGGSQSPPHAGRCTGTGNNDVPPGGGQPEDLVEAQVGFADGPLGHGLASRLDLCSA